MNIMVTGGGGFLGKALIRALSTRGHRIKSYSRGEYPELTEMGIEVCRGDLTDKDKLVESFRGCDAVFHVAAMAGIWGDYDDYYNTNFIGTKNVIRACRENRIKKLVYTSSPSVVFTGRDEEGVNEDVSYPSRCVCHYPATKAMAERAVIRANSVDLATVALRPHLIWGPGDNHLIPRLIARAKIGRLRLVGDGKNLIDTTYIDNAVLAHVLAMERLSYNSTVSGKYYFITNGEPLPIKVIFDKILTAGGLEPVEKSIPEWLAYNMGAVLEKVHKIMKKKEEPLMTRFLALQLSKSHWYDISSARRDLGYHPKVSINEGMMKLRDWLRNGGSKHRCS